MKTLFSIALPIAALMTLRNVAPQELSLPEPSGPFKVGTVALKLLDSSRMDPYAPNAQKRELMIQIYYPTRNTQYSTISPYMPHATAQFISHEIGLPNNTLQRVQTAVYQGAPIANANLPVVIFSPAITTSRLVYAALLSDLASRGYLVASIDHPYDADVVQFPGGKMVFGVLGGDITIDQINLAVEVRAADASFVINQLGSREILKHIPALHRRLDVRQVVMLGHSLGGASAATAIIKDSRIVAGANFDGTFRGPAVDIGLDRPFLIMSRTQHNRTTDESWAKMWSNLRSYKLQLKLANSEHYTFSDFPVLASLVNLTSPEIVEKIGAINGLRSLKIQSTYIAAYLKYIFRRKRDSILVGPDKRYPEITFDF
ncbi:alpha/beta-hydrolase [Basidiobolus meristosporus CBS 931.73]|uniref:1-alkyl-2-acetylglycerophosphocholine esterase n=1 Tax=Basidiobolus meristosporus CBS 931.73 TaxID=1314790 RepID=A0A1Y1Y0A0_9FUNG|nr:alpha/beta-hydrolase [Basidiobolus meristosporus CBS 931.73]|eukprot:ORX91325.1 alpha/beta-hydrolase [Basidiobolus meristosporus CBS 931.73]